MLRHWGVSHKLGCGQLSPRNVNARISTKPRCRERLHFVKDGDAIRHKPLGLG